MGCLRTLSTRGNVDTESLAAPSDSNWSVRFQETGDPFAKLAYADFDRGHRDAPHSECTLMCTHSQACQGFAGFAQWVSSVRSTRVVDDDCFQYSARPRAESADALSCVT